MSNWLDKLRFSPSYAKAQSKRYHKADLPPSKFFTGGFAYRFLKYLNAPIKEWRAYKLGIIDEEGNELRPPQTIEEKSGWNYFTKLVLALRKKLEKVVSPNRLKLILQSLFLIREKKEDEYYVFNKFLSYVDNINNNDIKIMVENVMNSVNEQTVSGDMASLGEPINDDPNKDEIAEKSRKKLKSFKKWMNDLKKTAPPKKNKADIKGY
jgi:hypothetical protein